MSRVFGADLDKWLLVRCKLTLLWRICPPVEQYLMFGGNAFETFEQARKRFQEKIHGRGEMNEWKVVAAALRPLLRRKGDDEFAAEQVIRGLAMAGFVLVELPVPTDLGPYGPVWATNRRLDGPIGTVQYRPEIRRIEIRDDFEHDYSPPAVLADAAVLLAAVCYADRAAAVPSLEEPR